MNEKSKDYKKLNLDKIRSSDMKEELLLKNAGLYKTPIIRNGSKATVGFNKDTWEQWINEK
ncbi:MAG: arsenate reductase family protein [Sarcina sp.]